MLGCRPLTDEEIIQIINSLTSSRDKCLFLLGVKTGFRVSELLSIEMKHLLEPDGSLKDSIKVDRKHMKGKVASRNIPLSNSLIEVLTAYIEDLPKKQRYLFESKKGNKLSRVQAWRVIKQAADKNKIKGKIATHSMRKSFCERVYNKFDKDLVKTQKAMGHKSISSTVSYISFTQSEIDDVIKSI